MPCRARCEVEPLSTPIPATEKGTGVAIDLEGELQQWGRWQTKAQDPPSGTFVNVSTHADTWDDAQACAIDEAGAPSCWGVVDDEAMLAEAYAYDWDLVCMSTDHESPDGEFRYTGLLSGITTDGELVRVDPEEGGWVADQAIVGRCYTLGMLYLNEHGELARMLDAEEEAEVWEADVMSPVGYVDLDRSAQCLLLSDRSAWHCPYFGEFNTNIELEWDPEQVLEVSANSYDACVTLATAPPSLSCVYETSHPAW